MTLLSRVPVLSLHVQASRWVDAVVRVANDNGIRWGAR
jgi:hypothetical protein